MRLTNKKTDIYISRVCAYCGQTVYVSKSNINDAIFYDKKTYHRKCFIEEKTHKEYRQVKILPTCKELLDIYNIDVSKYKDGKKYLEGGKEQLINDYNEARKKIFLQQYESEKKLFYDILSNIEINSVKHLSVTLDKEEIYRFILDKYDVLVVQKSIFTKLGEIYSGSYRGMSIGISPNELLDMWRRKIDYLDKIANQNLIKGKIMSSEQRINYDLSILVNKYDGYKKWKEKQLILKQEQIERVFEKPIIVTGIINKEEQDSNADDISNLVDDIFG